MQQHLTKEELLKELHAHSGFIPIDIDLNNKQLNWIDLEAYHCYEGFFHKSLYSFNALKILQTGKSKPATFSTNIDVLDDENILSDYVYPTAFIFHAGRCGSTLMAKVLARSRDNMVFSEANPHNQIWSLLSENGNVEINGKNKTIYKNLLLAMARKRLHSHKTNFIKFTSYNILFFDFIKSVFSDVPAIFLYREPLRILSSFQRNPSGWISSKDKFLSSLISNNKLENILEFAAKALICFFQTALNTKINLLNYNQLTPENLPVILKSLNANTSKEQIELMETQFNFNSKTEYQRHDFFVEQEKQNKFNEVIDNNLRDELIYLYEELLSSGLNIVTDY